MLDGARSKQDMIRSRSTESGYVVMSYPKLYVIVYAFWVISCDVFSYQN